MGDTAWHASGQSYTRVRNIKVQERQGRGVGRRRHGLHQHPDRVRGDAPLARQPRPCLDPPGRPGEAAVVVSRGGSPGEQTHRCRRKGICRANPSDVYASILFTQSFSPEDSVEEFSPHTRSFRLKPRHRLSWPRVDARSVVLPAASWYPNCVL